MTNCNKIQRKYLHMKKSTDIRTYLYIGMLAESSPKTKECNGIWHVLECPLGRYAVPAGTWDGRQIGGMVNGS
jgi:hypothetical protein